MKKIILYIFLIIILTFLIPIVFTIQFSAMSININNVEATEEPFSYGNYKTIRLLHEKTGEVEEIEIDEYLYGVVSSEMPANFEMEALKAQAVVARTYTIYKIKNNASKHENADICDNSKCCQAWISKADRLERWEEAKREEYWAKIVMAVDSTKGKIIKYEGEPINAFFHSNSGGSTEVPLNVWGGSGYPYLQVVQTSGEDTYSQYNSEVILTKAEVIEKVKVVHSEFEIDFNLSDAIKVLELNESGRVKTLKFGNVNLSGVEARNIFGLKSANFSIEQIEGDKIKFTVIGYGHGVRNEPNRSRFISKTRQ